MTRGQKKIAPSSEPTAESQPRGSSARGPSKHEQILTVAGQLFLQDGFQGLSMERLAAAVPVSKPTLYAHFADKEAIFAAVISTKCQNVLASLTADMASDAKDPVATLTRFGEGFTTMLYRPESLQFHRMMTAEAARLPEMTRLFYESGPSKVRALLERYLRGLHDSGVYVIPEAPLAADMFLGMLKGARHMRCILGLQKLPSETERRALVQAAVRVFLQGHRKQAPL